MEIIVKEINTELEKQRLNIINKKIKYLQRMYEKENYDNCEKNNKVKCIVCGGTYVKSVKCVHDRTKNHKKYLNEIYEKTSMISSHN
jgi:hypothetical protein